MMMCVCIHTYIRASSLIYVRMLIRTCSCTCMLVCSYPRTLVHVRLHVPLPLHVGVGVHAWACIRSTPALTPCPLWFTHPGHLPLVSQGIEATCSTRHVDA